MGVELIMADQVECFLELQKSHTEEQYSKHFQTRPNLAICCCWIYSV